MPDNSFKLTAFRESPRATIAPAPEGFKWQSTYGPGGADDTNAFAYQMHQVVRLDEKISGGWIATLHRPDGRSASRNCTSYASGRAGIEACADRHQEALIADTERKQEWESKQTWRSRTE